MDSKSVFMPDYSIGADVYGLVGQLCRPYGDKVVLVGGKTALQKALPYLKPQLVQAGLSITAELWYGGEASYENVEMLMAQPQLQDADLIVGVGGGKCLDTAKVTADRLGKPILTCPTIASNCAPCTKVCVMYEQNGLFKDLYHIQQPPLHTLICTRVIAEAPTQYLWAGIGDSFSKELEVKFCSRNDQLDHSNALGLALCQACTWPLLQYGEAALQANVQHEVNPALEMVALTIIISTGLVSNMIIHDYNTSLAHAFYYTYANLERSGHPERLHGELVAYGVLVLALADGQQQLLERIYPVAKALKLPTCLADLQISEQELPQIVAKMLQAKDVVYGPYQFDYETVHKAMLELESYNRQHE